VPVLNFANGHEKESKEAIEENFREEKETSQKACAKTTSF